MDLANDTTPPTVDETDAREFFCATRDGYEGPAGAIHTLKASDWDNPHRKRHLDNFEKSTKMWKTCGDEQKKRIALSDGAQLWAKSLIEWDTPVIEDRKTMDQVFGKLRKLHRCTPPVSDIVRCYRQYDQSMRKHKVESLLLKKAVRSMSGVSVITVLTAPGEFSCAFDCAYCPDEPGQPRSYLSTEPAVMRGNQNEWSACRQFWDRAGTLHDNGHTVDKLEVLVLGGTWSGYPEDYQEQFIRDLFYAANVLPNVLKNMAEDRPIRERIREKKTLKEEQIINEFSKEFHNEQNDMASWERVPRIIGLTLETRPDQITPREIHRLRYLGTTRVQMGVQHTNDKILSYIRRQCPIDVTKKALALLKNSCFKVDIHLMPDLPGANPQLDREMFEMTLSSPDLQADQWKVYPCEVTPFSSIEEWYAKPESDPLHYKPYADLEGGRVLVSVLAAMKRAVHPWIRLNRVIRDIPEVTIIGGNNMTNLRQVLTDVMGCCGWDCRCMRCREVREREINPHDAQLKIRRYPGDHGHHEYFISYESHDEKTLFAFLRLRVRKDCTTSKDHLSNPISSDAYWTECNPTSRMDGLTFMDTQKREETIKTINKHKAKEQRTARKNLVTNDVVDTMNESYEVFPELTNGIALIRELHVYGQIVATGEQQFEDGDLRAQHRGFGKMLLSIADRIAYHHGCYGLAVISGIGVRGYYRKQGFHYDRLGNDINDVQNAHYAFRPQHMDLDDPTEDLSMLRSLPRGEFLMKYCNTHEESVASRRFLELGERLVIEEYDCTTRLPDLTGYDLQTATKERLVWAKKDRELKKALNKKKRSFGDRLKIEMDKHRSEEPPKFGTDEYNAKYLLKENDFADSVKTQRFSHAVNTVEIRWDSAIKNLWIPSVVSDYLPNHVLPEHVLVGAGALAIAGVALGGYQWLRRKSD